MKSVIFLVFLSFVVWSTEAVYYRCGQCDHNVEESDQVATLKLCKEMYPEDTEKYIEERETKDETKAKYCKVDGHHIQHFLEECNSKYNDPKKECFQDDNGTQKKCENQSHSHSHSHH